MITNHHTAENRRNTCYNQEIEIGFSKFKAGIVFCQLVIKLQLYSLCEIIILALDYNPLKHMDYNTSYSLLIYKHILKFP